MFATEMDPREKKAKMHILDDLIGYMRKLELGKDDSKNPLEDGLDMAEDKMADRSQRDLDEKPSHVEIEIESPEEEEREMAGEAPSEEEEEEEEGEKITPFQKEMKNYFNDTDRPKMGTSMSFMVESKKPIKKDVVGISEKMSKKKRGRPFKG